jgi:TetR/AcrR family transcriptional repressor of nem operon
MSKGESTRQRILEQTAPLFNKRGFRSAAMSEIMEVTGMQKGGIYNHFRSKEELALAAFDYATGLIRHRFEAAPGERSSTEILKSSIERFRRHRLNPALAGGCPLLNGAVESDDGVFPALRTRVAQAMQHWHGRIEKLVANGCKRREFRAGTDAKAVASVMVACLEGAVLLSRLHADPEHMTRCCDHLVAYVDSLRNT